MLQRFFIFEIILLLKYYSKIDIPKNGWILVSDIYLLSLNVKKEYFTLN